MTPPTDQGISGAFVPGRDFGEGQTSAPAGSLHVLWHWNDPARKAWFALPPEALSEPEAPKGEAHASQ